MKANERGVGERTKHGRRLSLMAKLGGGTALLALLLVAVTAGSAVVIFSNYLDRDAREKSEAAVRGLESILEAKREETRVVSLFLARYGNIVEDVAAGNADALLQKLTPMWKESDLDFVTVLDAKGNVVVRLHEPDKKGDSLAGQANVKGALRGEITTAIEPGTQIPLSVRTGVPLKNASGAVVGALSAGISFSREVFVEQAKEMFGAEMTMT